MPFQSRVPSHRRSAGPDAGQGCSASTNELSSFQRRLAVYGIQLLFWPARNIDPLPLRLLGCSPRHAHSLRVIGRCAHCAHFALVQTDSRPIACNLHGKLSAKYLGCFEPLIPGFGFSILVPKTASESSMFVAIVAAARHGCHSGLPLPSSCSTPGLCCCMEFHSIRLKRLSSRGSHPLISGELSRPCSKRLKVICLEARFVAQPKARTAWLSRCALPSHGRACLSGCIRACMAFMVIYQCADAAQGRRYPSQGPHSARRCQVGAATHAQFIMSSC